MDVYVFAGLEVVLSLQPLPWWSAGFAVTGGQIESVAAEHGLLPQVEMASATVRIGDSGGGSGSLPSGLVCTVTFSTDTDMAGVRIDYTSLATSVVLAGGGAVTWEGTPRVAIVVQDTRGYMYVFTSDHAVSTLEIGLSSSAADLTMLPLISGLVAQIGPDFWGVSRLDGAGTPLEQGVKLALASHQLDIDASHAKTAVVPLDISAPFDSVVFVVGAGFHDRCDSCIHLIKKLGNAGSIDSLSDGDECQAGSSASTYMDGKTESAQDESECYVSTAGVIRMCVVASPTDDYGYEDPASCYTEWASPTSSAPTSAPSSTPLSASSSPPSEPPSEPPDEPPSEPPSQSPSQPPSQPPS
jgi:hypothetical protein